MRVICCALAALWIAAGMSVSAATPEPVLSAKSAALYDVAGGRFLYVKNADDELPMASTTKVMTALVALESLSPDQTVIIERAWTLIEGSSMYLKADEELSVDALLHGLLLMSGNDAAMALAGACGGEDVFVARMNEVAQALGLAHTHFENPHGLDVAGHYSSARDMALLCARCMQIPEFCDIVGIKSVECAGRYMQNHNKLLWQYEGVCGIKTGYTVKAGRCLVSACVRDGRMLIGVTLYAPGDWDDHMKMFDYGFENFPGVQLVNMGDVFGDVPVVSGLAQTSTVLACGSQTAYLSEQELEQVTVQAYLPPFVYAPVRAGDRAGELVYSLDGQEIARAELIYGQDIDAVEPVKVGFFRRIWEALARVWLRRPLY